MKQKPKTKSSTSHTMSPWQLKIGLFVCLKPTKTETINSTEPIARIDVEGAGCEICCDPGTREEHTEQGDLPTTDMYRQCSVCNCTYHWTCLKLLQCYKEEDRNNIDAQSDWNCPACHNLSLDEKKLGHVHHNTFAQFNLEPHLGAKLTNSLLASFRQMIQIYEAKQIAPPPLDEGLGNRGKIFAHQ